MLFKILHFVHEPGIPEVFYKKGVLKNQIFHVNTRSSHRDMFCQKYVPNNFAKLFQKSVCLSFSFNNVAGWKPETLLKK